MNAKRILVLLPLILAAGLLLGGFMTVQAAPAANCTWVGGSGNWSDAGHWSCGAVPGAADTATIDGYPTVTLDMDVEVANLNLDDGYLTGSGHLTVTQSFVMSGWMANMSGSGVTTIAPSATMTITSGSAGNPVFLRSVDNYGKIIIAGDAGNRFDMGGGVVLTNQPGGVVDIQTNRIWMYWGGTSTVQPVFNNRGTITKSTAGQAYFIDVFVDNAGLIEISNDGSLRIAAYRQSGEVKLNDEASSILLSGTGNLNAGSTFDGSGEVVVSGEALVNADISIPNLVLQGTITGSGNFTITQSLDMSYFNPRLVGSGMTTIAPSATLTLTGCSAGQGGIFRNVENHGLIIVGGDPGNRLDIGNDLTITNHPGGVIDIQSNRAWVWYPALYNRPVIDNQGTITKFNSGGAGIWDIQINNTGLISLANGGLSMGYSNHSGQVIFDDADAYLDLNGSQNRINDGAVFSGAGWVYSRSDVYVSGAVLIPNLVQENGRLMLGDPSTANLTITGEFRRTGGEFQVHNNSAVWFDGDQVLLNLDLATAFHHLGVVTDTLLIEVNPVDHAVVNGDLTNLGVIRKVQSVGGAGNLTFGLTGAAISVAVPGTLTELQVDRYDANHPNANEQTSTGRYWQITPSGAGYTVHLTLPHSYINHQAVMACRYAASDWDCERSSSTLTAVTRNDITQLSDWAVSQPPSLDLVKTAIDVNGAPLQPGDVIQYKIEITNTNAFSIESVVLTDSTPLHTTYLTDSDSPEADADANPLVWSGLDFAPGEGRSFEFRVVVDADAAGETVSNSACISQPDFDVACTPNVTPSDGGEVIPVLEFVKTAQDLNGHAIQEGDIIRYTITLTNPHALTVTQVTVTDTIPAHTTYVLDSDTPEAGADVDPLVWNNLALLPGETLVIQFSVMVSEGALGQQIENIACVTQPGAAQVCTPPVTPPGGGMVKTVSFIPIVFKQPTP